MQNKKQTPIIYVEKNTESEWLTLADIGEDELTDEQKEIVAQFEALAENYCQQVEKLDWKLLEEYHKLKKNNHIDDALLSILEETVHQLTQRQYYPGYKRNKIK